MRRIITSPVRASIWLAVLLVLALLVLLGPPIGNRQSAKLPADKSTIGNVAYAQGPSPFQLATARHHHTATLQMDGTVLIAGGKSSGQVLSTAEIIDVANGAVLPLNATMTSPRGAHTASSTAFGTTVLLAGEDPQGRQSGAESYQPSSGTFGAIPLVLPVPRSGAAAVTLSSGEILVTGGWNGSNVPTPTAVRISPTLTVTTATRGQLGTARGGHAMVLLPSSGDALVLGGYDSAGQPLKTLELYRVARDVFETLPFTMTEARADAAALLLPDGRILVAGGIGRSDSESLDLAAGTSVSGPALNGPRSGHTATLTADGRILLVGGSADSGQTALSALDLLPAQADHVPPGVVATSPQNGAGDVALDARLWIRFSEPLNVKSGHSGSIVLTGPQGRVETTWAWAESGLLLFVTPSGLERATTYRLSLVGLTDGAGNALPAYSTDFTTTRGAGELPTIASFSPTAGAVGSEVTIRGANLLGTARVAFGGIGTSQYTVVGATEIKAHVGPGSLSGPISLATPSGTAQSQGWFLVQSTPDFALRLAPDRGGETIVGDQYTFALNVVPSGGFLGMVRLSVGGLPAQLKGTFDKPQLGPVGFAYLTIAAAEQMRPGHYRFNVVGTSTLGGQEVQRVVEATLRVHPPAGTSLSGQLVQFDGTPIPNYTVRIDKQNARTDVAGNFLLKHLKVSKTYDDLVIVLDGRTARAPSGFLYPVFEKLLEYESIKVNRPNRFPHGGGPMWIPTMDPRNAARVEANSSRDQVLKFPHLPGFEITVPAGTTFKDIDGHVPSSLLVHVVETPLHLAQMHLQHHPAGGAVSALLSIQLGGTVPSKPVRVTAPNLAHLDPGSRVPLYFYDVTKDGWYSPGQGTVSDDGQQIVSDLTVGMTRFGCFAQAPPVPGKPVPVSGSNGADPVDLATGVFVLTKTDMVLPGRMPIVFTRTYRSEANRSGPFGYGWTNNFMIKFGSVTLNTLYQVVLPTDSRLDFLASESYIHRATPTFYGARLQVGPIGGNSTVTLKDGTVWTFNNLSGFLLAIEDRHGNRLDLIGPSSSLPTAIRMPDGRQVGIEYDSSHRITRIAAWFMGQVVTYTYTAAGDLETVTDPMGGVTRYTYDSNHNMLTIRDPRGITSLINEYHPISKRVIGQTMPGGSVWQLAYIPATTTTDTVTQTVVTDPRGKQTTYNFNSAGYVTSVTNPLSQTTTITREPGSNVVTEIVDRLGRRTVLGYDSNKNLTSATRYLDPPANTQPVTYTFVYHPTLNVVTSAANPLGRTWTFGRDAQGNLISITNPAPISKTWTIQPDPTTSQPQWIEDPLTHRTTFTYNSLGLLETTRDHLNNTDRYTYDELGRRTAVTDPRGFSTRFAYDLNNRLTAIADPMGRAIQFEYDLDGNVTKVTDPRGGTIQYTYDNLNRVETRTNPLGLVDRYDRYDLAGNLERFIDRKNQLTTFTYDDPNRLLTATYYSDNGITLDSTTTYHYDAGGRLDWINDSLAGFLTYGYDALDRLTREETPQGVVTYDYDNASRRQSLNVAGLSPVSYLFDEANRLRTVTQGASVATYGYDDANRRTSLRLPNGVQIDYGYDQVDRLTGLTYTGPGGPLGDLAYTYDPASNRTRMAGSWARTSLPDPIPAASYNDANQQLTLGGKTMTYDNNGNIATLTEGGNTTTYTWDPRDRLITLSGPSLSATFAYDATGRRTQKTVSGQTTSFQYDIWDIVHEVTGATEVDYLRGLGIDEPLVRNEAGITVQYLSDAVGSPLALTDGDGAVTTSYTYGAFGQTTAAGAASTNPFQYTGRENDGTGLYYYRARYYDARLGRFVNEDPIGLAGGDVNLYSYVFNNPTNAGDPLGLSAVGTVVRVYTQGGQLVRQIKEINPRKLISELKETLKELGKEGDRAIVRAENEAARDAIGRRLSDNGRLRTAPGGATVEQSRGGYPPHVHPDTGPFCRVHVQCVPPGRHYARGAVLAKILTPHSWALSNDPSTTAAEFASAALWDIISAVDPIFLTDVIEWTFGLEKPHFE